MIFALIKVYYEGRDLFVLVKLPQCMCLALDGR